MTLRERLDIYEQLVRLDKPIGILLLLWPTLWGLWLSSYGNPNPVVFVIFVLGVVLTRSAGCIVNDIADRDFDPQVERTRNRPLARRAIPVAEAIALAAVLFVLAFALVLQLNRLTIQLAFVALALAIIYPFLKRVFWLPQAWLGIAFGFGIPMAFAAHQNAIPPVAWWLLAANVFWSIAYDTEYAMVDRDDDVRIGMKTSAILFGERDVFFTMLCQALFLGGMLWIGVRFNLGIVYLIGITLAAALAVRQYFILRPRTRDASFKAFLHNNWIGAVIFAGIVADFALRIPAPWIRLH
ncbi:MAG: 4-hydroxybenzoate octaprenyltransferase [Burkholderiales bacterium]|nr:4-hydroxybenzoate octaprenyltransferase [Burkholderiales bacterium]